MLSSSRSTKVGRLVSPKASKKLVVIAILSALVVGGLISFSREELGKIWRTILSADLRLVLCAVGLYFFEVLFWAARWRVSLSTVGYRVNLKSLYLISHAGMFFSNITPVSKSGGEPFRAYFVKKIHNVPYSVGFATILAESFLTLPPILGLLTLGTILCIWFSPSSVSVVFLGTVIFFVGGFTFLVYLFIKRRLAARSIFRIIKRIAKTFGLKLGEGKVRQHTQRFYRSAKLVIGNRKSAFLILTLATLLYLASAVRVLIILLALGVRPPLAAPLLAVTVPLLAGAIPLLPGGLVFFEGTMIAVLVGCGINFPVAVSATLIERGISHVLSTLAGALAASYLGVKNAVVKR